MTSPRLLFKFMLLSTFIVLATVYVWLTSQVSLGFEVAEDPNTHQLVISKVSPELMRQGLKLGSEIVSIGSGDQTVKLNVTHFFTTPIQRKSIYQNKGQYFSAQEDLYDAFSQPVIRLNLIDQPAVDVTLTGSRSLMDIPNTTWIRFFLGLVSALMGVLVWTWHPSGKETIYYALGGIGLFLAIIPSAIDAIPMLLRSYSESLFLDSLRAFGNYTYIGFGVSALLYFPQKLPHADRFAKRILIVTALFSCYALFNTWDFSIGFDQQRLYFSDVEIYVPVLIGFIFVVVFSIQQWRFSRHKPVERARSSWVVLSWSVGLLAYMLFYYVPIISGAEPLMGRTLAWLAVCSSYWMILLGLSRFQLFDLEHNINTVWEWSIVFIVFLLIDMAFASLAIITPQLSTFVILCLILWVYMPLRQWLSSRVVRKKIANKNKLFSDAVAELLSSKEDDPKNTWQEILVNVFAPRAIEWRDEAGTTAVEDGGQGLFVAGNRFSPPMYLDFAEQGERLFGVEDVGLVVTMSALFEQLFEFHLAFLAGQNTERERIRRDLHDQIGHKLLSLIYAAGDDKVKIIAQETLEQLRGLITALRLEPVSLQSTVMEIRLVAEEASDNFDFKLDWNNCISDVSIVIGSYQYLNIINIARELLNNIVRHANASEVSIVLAVDASSLIMQFNDNGIGLDREDVVMGNGLYNIDARVRELNATIDWHRDTGCSVTITIPLLSPRE
jgi:signal transduction histidine kinase